jgi:hypothetical protein
VTWSASGAIAMALERAPVGAALPQGGALGSSQADTAELAKARRAPDFFIVGHEKCGTTALYRILRSHPQIYMPELKEPRFFARDPDWPQEGAGPYPRTLDAYLDLFADAGEQQLAGEASPQYIRSPQAAERIAEVQPAARAIAILREPVGFLRSFHLACVREGLETQRDLGKALALEDERRQGLRIPRGCRAPGRLLYSEHVRYAEQLSRFDRALSPDHVHVVVYDDLRRENERTARAVLSFLGVDATLAIDISNSTGRARKAVRSGHTHRLALALKRARRKRSGSPGVLRAIDLAPAWLEGAARRVLYAPPPPIDVKLARELRSRFRPEVVALGDRLGRDLLREWGYED